ncbi:hypothetical protein C8F01DRAFT_1106869 [Mycena amicta]|nr:hypothetical protein C8F01DRAFT_1106869 [Mycena amicta]
MAAMELARSLSNSLLPTPPGSATAESFRSEPHYRLSRLNTPLDGASLRPPSLISRSVSAGFAFKKDREMTPEKLDERPPSRSIFKLRKKTSLASMTPSRVDDSSRSSSAGPSSLAVSHIHETPPQTPTFPMLDVDPKDRPQFQPKDHWRIQHKVKLHPYPDAPYMQSFEATALDNERYSHELLRRLLPDASPTFHDYKRNPPQSVLELGCGIGSWLQDAARLWRTTQFVGFDLVNVALPSLTDGTLPNVRLQLGDFLNYPLPFGKNTFDLVRMANLALCVPFDRWEDVLREVNRVLVPGGRLELIDDQTIFPYGDAPAEESPDAVLQALNDLTTPTALEVARSTPRPPPRTPEASTFFDSDSDDESDESKPDSSMASTSDSASEHSSFTDTASTLIGEPSERGSVELKKTSDFGAPKIDFEPTHRPFSGVDHLIISIPPPEPLATIELSVEGETPLTPVPPMPTRVPDTPPLSAATLDVVSDSSAPSTPSTIATELAEDNPSGPWTSKVSAARTVERVYQRMVATHFRVHTKPSDMFPSVLSKVFANVELPAAMHLKLAPPDAPERKDLVHQGIPERRKKERATPMVNERSVDTQIPQGLSAKAAERLGIAGAGAAMGTQTLRRQPTMSTLSGTPEESDEDEYSDDDVSSDEFSDSEDSSPVGRPPLQRGASDWVPPNEWDAPPPPRLQRMGSAPLLHTLLSSSSSKTITPSASSKTITPSSVSQTFKVPPSLASPNLKTKPLAHTRNGSAASTASAMSTASGKSTLSSGAYSESTRGPQKYAEKRVQHPGLILWPSTFIPMRPQELEYHATKHVQTLLGCKPALAQYVAMFKDPLTRERYVSEEEFEQSLWDYECFLRPRLNWPQLAEAQMEDDDGEHFVPTPASATFLRDLHPSQQIPRPVIDSKGRVTMPFGADELTHVRTFRIYGATKGTAAGGPVRKNTASSTVSGASL